MHMEFIQYLSMLGVQLTPAVTTGSGMDFLIGRVSYTFGLTGGRSVSCYGILASSCATSF